MYVSVCVCVCVCVFDGIVCPFFLLITYEIKFVFFYVCFSTYETARWLNFSVVVARMALGFNSCLYFDEMRAWLWITAAVTCPEELQGRSHLCPSSGNVLTFEAVYGCRYLVLLLPTRY